jgi:hypothetical protein
MSGEGIFAEQLKNMFEVNARRAGLNLERFALSTEHFRPPGGEQLTMF